MLNDAEKPFQKTNKKSTRRSAILTLYTMEVDNLFANAESKGTYNKIDVIDVTNKSVLQNFIQGVYITMTGKKKLASDENIFNAGADSLQMIIVVQKPNSRLSPGDAHRKKITSSMIYFYFTVQNIISFLQKSTKIDIYETSKLKTLQSMEMQVMIDKYNKHPSKRSLPHSVSLVDSFVVILTGNTGSLGFYLLDILFKHDNVSKIYCLNRTVNNVDRQTKSNEMRGLSVN